MSGTLITEFMHSLMDPISMELMVDPVLTEDGLCYDRKSIEEWFDCCDDEYRDYCSPATNKVLKSRKIIDNIGLRKILESTVDYLSKLDMEGELGEYEKALLSSYRERAKELAMEKQKKYDSLEHLRAMNVCCQGGHKMQYYKQNTICPTYRGMFFSSIICNECCKRDIQSQGEYYFHCSQCGYDLCTTCSLHRHEEEQLSSRIAFPRSDSMEEFRYNHRRFHNQVIYSPDVDYFNVGVDHLPSRIFDDIVTPPMPLRTPINPPSSIKRTNPFRRAISYLTRVFSRSDKNRNRNNHIVVAEDY
jgi:hypothetical protein